MVRLVYSNRTEELLAELATRVRAQQLRDGALVPVRLVVPSASVEAYVRLGVARACGIAANLESALLTRFAAEIVAAGSGQRVADAQALEAMALTLLLDDAELADPELTPVRAYLRGGGEGADSMDARRVQLAARLGRLFEEYTYSRADMLNAWRRGTTLQDRHHETEVWQRRLWLAMFGAGGLAEKRARAGAPRVAALHEAVAALEPRADALPRGVHVFGFAHFARGFHDLLQRIGRVTDVVVYALSPCEGFWEDADAREPDVLVLWGRPGRQQVRALNAIAGFDHDDRFADPLLEAKAPTLLGQVQSDLLRREPPSDRADVGPRFEHDESITILEHASVRRELEAVASEIWRLVESDPSLRFDEIAVLVPDADAGTYATQLPTVFREAYALPHQTIGVPLAQDSRIVEAIELLLALPFGRFTRQELLRLAVHPAVVASLGDVDPRRWTAWCDALGVVHGADRKDHADTYIERDILNWDQGLRRLALGAFMTGDASGEPRPFECDGEQYVPLEVPASELRDAAGFGVLVRSLLADARFALQAELTMREWGAFLRALVEAYVVPTGAVEEEELARCLRRVYAIRDMDVGDRRVRPRVAFAIARAAIGGLTGGRGGEGVVVSTLVSPQSLPMRVVFACGMGEGRFPSPDAEDPLDLRWARRLEGDVTARERDKYAFLEVLLGTRERLYLSYVSRDPLTGEALAPSSVVQELSHALERGYVRDVASRRVRHPLRRWDPAYFPDLFPSAGRSNQLPMRLPEARAEARTLALRRSLESSGARVDRQEVLARSATDPEWRRLADHLELPRVPEPRVVRDGRVVVPMYAIVKFLEFPLQGWARFRIGLDEADDEDLMAREDEPFETDARDETLILRDVLLDAVATGRGIEDVYDDAVRARELRGLGPSGVFARGERRAHLDALATWRGELEARHISLAGIEVHRFGRASENARADRAHGPVPLDVDVVDATGTTRVVRVEVGGRTLPLGAEAGASITLFKRAKEDADNDWARASRERAALRAFVDHAVLSSAGVAAERPHASVVVVATPDGCVTDDVSFEAMSRDEASTWLRGVVRELLGGPHAYFLPCEAVFVRSHRDPNGPVRPWLEKARDILGDSDGPLGLRSAYGPVPRPHEYPVPEEDMAREMIARRFGVLFAKRGVKP